MTVRVPKYGFHKGSGQALVEIAGRRIYLGRHGSVESREAYRRAVASVLSPTPAPVEATEPLTTLTVNALILGYFRFART